MKRSLDEGDTQTHGRESGSGGTQVRLPDVDIKKLSGLKNELVCRFKLAADMIGGGIKEFVNDVDGGSIPGKGADG